MKFDACPVEPPGLGNGPLSIWTMSRQPSSARWPTTEFPTMPDPITTTFAVVGRSLTGRTLRRRSWEHRAQSARRVGDVRRDHVGVAEGGKAVARTVTMNRGDRGALRVDDWCRDRCDAIVEFAGRPRVALAADRREPALEPGRLDHGRTREAHQGTGEIRGHERRRLRGEQNESRRHDVQGEASAGP